MGNEMMESSRLIRRKGKALEGEIVRAKIAQKTSVFGCSERIIIFVFGQL